MVEETAEPAADAVATAGRGGEEGFPQAGGGWGTGRGGGRGPGGGRSCVGGFQQAGEDRLLPAGGCGRRGQGAQHLGGGWVTAARPLAELAASEVPQDASAGGGGPLVVAHQEVQVQAFLPAPAQQEEGGERPAEVVTQAAQPPLHRLLLRAQDGGGLPDVQLLSDAQVQQLVLVDLQLPGLLPGDAGQVRRVDGRDGFRQAGRIGHGEGLLALRHRRRATTQPVRQVAMGGGEELELEQRLELTGGQPVVDPEEARQRHRRRHLPVSAQAEREVVDAGEVPPVELAEGCLIAFAGAPGEFVVVALLGVHAWSAPLSSLSVHPVTLGFSRSVLVVRLRAILATPDEGGKAAV